jgi:hypothetical protein
MFCALDQMTKVSQVQPVVHLSLLLHLPHLLLPLLHLHCATLLFARRT